MSPEIHSAGQPFLQIPQRLHESVSMMYLTMDTQTPAGHFLSTTWATYSSLKYFSVERTGLGALCPSPHNAEALMFLARISSLSRSSRVPLPYVILTRISCILFVPIRHGGHLPHDSSTVKSRKNLARSTIHVCSSITIRPPDPIIEPSFVRES